MNKLIRRLAMAFVGISMAVGVGVALSSREAVPVHATSEEVSLSSGTFSTDHITWTLESGGDTIVTIQQLKGTSGTAVNKSYIEAPRVYKGHVLSFVASEGYKINSITLTISGTYYGNSMTAGTSISGNTVTDNTDDVDRTWTSTSGGKHVVSDKTGEGLSSIYIQNVATTNVQLRFTKLEIDYLSGTPATINGSSTAKAGTQWSPTNITVDGSDPIEYVTGVTYSFSATNDVVLETNTSTGAFTAPAPCTVTVSATKNGYNIANKTVTVSYADVTSITLSQYSATISKGADFNVGEVIVTVNPSAYAEQTYSWEDYSNTVNDEYLWDDSELVLTAGDVAGTVTMRVTSGGQHADLVITISGDPLITLDKAVINAYSIDDPVSLTATPENFGDATIVYSWSSSNTSVATIPNNDSTSNSVSFVSGGRGSSTITVTASVGGEEKASATCTVNVTKTRSVTESSTPFGTFDFSGGYSSSNALSYYYDEESTLSLTSATPTNCYAAADSIRLNTSKAGSLAFVFGENVTSVSFNAKLWSANETSSTVQVTNGANTVTVTDYEEFQPFSISLTSATNSVTINTTAVKRIFIRDITFNGVTTNTPIGTTADVVGLENFIDTYLRSDLAYDADPELDVNNTTECESLYPSAKLAFNGTSGTYKLNDHQRLLFTTNSAYTNELARLNAWATHIGDSLNEDTHVLEANRGSLNSITNFSTESSATIIIIIASLAGVIAVGGYFVIRRRKENN